MSPNTIAWAPGATADGSNAGKRPSDWRYVTTSWCPPTLRRYSASGSVRTAPTSTPAATTKPASGPAAPMSNSWRVRRSGSLIRMTAPNVPSVPGSGIGR